VHGVKPRGLFRQQPVNSPVTRVRKVPEIGHVITSSQQANRFTGKAKVGAQTGASSHLQSNPCTWVSSGCAQQAVHAHEINSSSTKSQKHVLAGHEQHRPGCAMLCHPSDFSSPTLPAQLCLTSCQCIPHIRKLVLGGSKGGLQHCKTSFWLTFLKAGRVMRKVDLQTPQ
jgi:hypothetical protein